MHTTGRIYRDVLGKFTHLVYFAIHRILIGNAQNLIRLKRNIQGYKTELPVEIILGGIEFSGECFFKIADRLKADGIEVADNLCRVSAAGVVDDLGVQVIGSVGRESQSWPGIDDRRLLKGLVFSKVHQAHHIAGIGGGTISVGNPYFKAQQLHLRVDHRKVFHGLVVIPSEMLCQHKVPVLLVFIRFEFEGRTA